MALMIFSPALRFTALLFTMACVATTPTVGQEKETVSADGSLEEHWYRIEIGGQPAGFQVEKTSKVDGLLRTESRFELELRRAGNRQRMAVESGFVETLDGRPVRAWSKQELGLEPIETRYEFLEDRVLVQHLTGGEVREEQLPAPPPGWSTPRQEAARLRERLASGEDAFTEQSLDPLLGLEPVRVSWRREASGIEIRAAGRAYLTDRWSQRQSLAPEMVSDAYLTAEGLLVRSTTQLMGTEMTLELSSQEAVAGATSRAPELLVSTFVAPSTPIASPRRLKRAVYELRPLAGDLPELPSAGAQQVERQGGKARITVEVGRSSPLDGEGGAEALASYLRPSAHADPTDPRVLSLVERADPGSEEGSARRAEALRAYVYRYLDSKDLGSLLATAGEAAASRSGDCTEHTVLLMAMLRAIDIPARAATGLVYVESFVGARNVFGYHMWAQAVIGGRWVDLDATTRQPFDAAHILFATSALDDRGSAFRDMAGLFGLMGNIGIEILEVDSAREERP